jgi:hypothetical protein
MALERARNQGGFQDPRDILGDRLREGTLYRLLADDGPSMFPMTISPTCTCGRCWGSRRCYPGCWRR